MSPCHFIPSTIALTASAGNQSQLQQTIVTWPSTNQFNRQTLGLSADSKSNVPVTICCLVQHLLANQTNKWIEHRLVPNHRLDLTRLIATCGVALAFGLLLPIGVWPPPPCAPCYEWKLFSLLTHKLPPLHEHSTPPDKSWKGQAHDAGIKHGKHCSR